MWPDIYMVEYPRIKRNLLLQKTFKQNRQRFKKGTTFSVIYYFSLTQQFHNILKMVFQISI